MPNAGENISEIVARLKRDLLPTMINGVMYWPICDFITFRFIPVQLQVRTLHFHLPFSLHVFLEKMGWEFFALFYFLSWGLLGWGFDISVGSVEYFTLLKESPR